MAIEFDFVPTNFDHLDCRTKEDHPELFRPEIKRPAGDFFTYEELIEFLELSPANLVSCLRRHKDIIKIYSATLTKQDRDWFYDYSVDPIECLYAFHDAQFHYIEVRDLRRALVSERQKMGEPGVQTYLGEVWGEPLEDYPRNSDANIWSYVTRRDELQSEGKDARIAELETQLAKAEDHISDLAGDIAFTLEPQNDNLKKQLKEKDTHIAKLEKEVSELKEQLAATQPGPGSIPQRNKGLAGIVCHMRGEGRTDEEIAAYLHDDGKWCTQAQVGALLHADESRVASESMQQRARRLLGKA